MKKSKKDQKKIVAFYIKKYEEYYKMNSNDLVLLQDQKMSSTQKLALRDAINQKMKEEIMNQRLKNSEEKPIIDLNRESNEGNQKRIEETGGGEENTIEIKEESK